MLNLRLHGPAGSAENPNPASRGTFVVRVTLGDMVKKKLKKKERGKGKGEVEGRKERRKTTGKARRERVESEIE